MSNKLAALIKKEILVLSKDWHGLMVLFLMPAAFILIMSMAMENTFGNQKSPAVSYVVFDNSSEALPVWLHAQIQKIPGFHAVDLPASSKLDDVTAGIIRGDYDLAIVIPPDFRQRLIKTTADDPSTLPAAASILFAPDVKTYTQKIFSASFGTILIRQKIAWLLNNNPDPTAPPTMPMSTLNQFSQLNLDEQFVYSDVDASAVIPNAVQQNVPAWLVFAMFFVVIPLSTVFLIEKQQSTLLRLRVMNITPTQILLGKLVPYFIVNQIQMLAMIAIGIIIVPILGGQQLNMPHSLTGLIIISSACSLAAIGFALLVATMVKTTMQATTTGGVVNIIFGALGGIMVPKFIMPETMQSLTNISPMAWGLEGFLDIFLRQHNWQAVIPEAIYLSAFGILCFAIAVYRFNSND